MWVSTKKSDALLCSTLFSLGLRPTQGGAGRHASQ